MVTHDLNLASQFASRLWLLDEGRLVAEGGPDAVLARDVLEPVYGEGLTYGQLTGPGGRPRPFVLPWRDGRPGEPDRRNLPDDATF